MDINIFDSYNIRARLSVYVIIISPIILTLYLLYEPVRSFSFSALFVVILSAFSNYLFALQRYLRKKLKKYPNTAAEFLFVNDTHIDKHTKQRYYQKLSQLDSNFAIFNTPSDNDDFKSACVSAIKWLRNNTRDNNLVQEENMLFGFYKNLVSLKNIGLLLTLVSAIIQAVSYNIYALQSAIYLWLIAIDICFLLFWLFGVTDKIRTVLAEKYAYALLGTLDSFTNA